MSEKLWATPRSYSFNTSHQPGLTTLDCQVRGLYPDQERYHGVSTDSKQLTLFAEAFPASRTVSLADVPDRQTSATSGPSSSDSFASLNPDGSWRKTCQGYSQVTLDGSLEPFSETWPRAGMTRNGTAYQRVPSAPLTDAIESGSWPIPTPTAGDSKNARNATAVRHKIPPTGIHAGYTLTDHVTLWPTPNVPNGGRKPKGGMSRTGVTPDGKKRQVGLENAVRMELQRLPTPTVVTNTGGSAMCKWGGSGARARLREMFSETELNGALNPTWVEWLMGYPLGWTACEGWGTASSRKSRNGSPGASSKRKKR